MTFTRAALTQFIELQGKHYPPDTLVWIVEESQGGVTIETRDGRRGVVSPEGLAAAPARPDNEPRAPAGRYRLIGQDRFSFEEPPYAAGDFDTLDEARSAQRKIEDSQRGAGNLADGLIIYDDRGRVVR